MATMKESRERSESPQKMVIQKLVAENMSVIEEVRVEIIGCVGAHGGFIILSNRLTEQPPYPTTA